MTTLELPLWRRLALLSTILLGTLLGPLDSAVNISFPDITNHFGLPVKSIRWVVICYVATYASLMLLFGRIGDLYGHDKVFIGGLVVCGAGFILCSSAGTYEALLAARSLQGVGTAMVLSCGPALATNLFEVDKRPQVLGSYAMMFGLGGALGPSMGGLLVEHWGWPAVFWARLPIAMAALVLVLALKLPAPQRDAGRLNVALTALLAVASGSLLYALSQIEAAFNAPQQFGLAAMIALVALASLIAVAWRSGALLNHAALSHPGFVWSNLSNIVVNVAAFATMLFVPYFLVTITETPLWIGGLIMAVGPIGMMIGSQVGGWQLRRFGGITLALVAACLVTMGLFWTSSWHAQTDWLQLAGALLVQGIGLGMFQVACLEITTSTLPSTQRGVAGSLALVMRTIGVVVAASLLTLLFADLQQGSSAEMAFVNAFQTTFLACSIGLAGFIAMSLVWLGMVERRRS